MNVLVVAVLFPWLVLALSRGLGSARTRRLCAWALPLVCIAVAVWLGPIWQPWERLLASTVWLLYALKGTVLLRRSQQDLMQFSGAGLIVYSSVWPGMDPAPFRQRQVGDREARKLLGEGAAVMAGGALLFCMLSEYASQLSGDCLGWAGVAAILLTVHFGFTDVLSASLRLWGWPVERAFVDPLASRSLRDFWSRRWNVPFIEMDRILFLRPLYRRLGPAGAMFGVFVISGLLHDFALSYPAGAGWGLPLAYFCLQGAGVLVESRLADRFHPPEWLLRTAAWLVVLVPVPMLFHAPFRAALIVPLLRGLPS